MANKFILRIITPEKVFFNGEVESLVFKTLDGKRGVMAGHAPMVAAISTAPIEMKTDTGWRSAAMSGGFVQVSGNEVSIFSDIAEWPEDIEENRALAAKQRAEEHLHEKLSDMEYRRARAALERALMRLSLKKR